MSEPQDRPVEAKDFMGNMIKAGDTVCYPVRRGSSMWLKKLTVATVQDTPRGVCISGMNISRRTLSRLTSNGEVPSVKIGRLRRYSRQALLDWVETKSNPST